MTGTLEHMYMYMTVLLMLSRGMLPFAATPGWLIGINIGLTSVSNRFRLQ